MNALTAGGRVGAAWKENWAQTRQRFIDWWGRRGFLVGGGAVGASTPHADVPDPGSASSFEATYTDTEWRVKNRHYRLSRTSFVADSLPVAEFGLGPGALGLYLGSEPNFTPNTVWYEPRPETLEDLPELRLDPANRWWQLTERAMRAAVGLSDGNYYVGIPDLIENFDTLAQLVGTEPLLFAMIERPELVSRRIAEINRAFFDAYDRIYAFAADPEGGIVFDAFRLWAPGTVAKVQCDGSACFSPDMLAQFVVPALAEQCAWLDYSMYHLDGTQCIGHLDHLLAIDDLDAIEWTPQAGLPGGGDPVWFDIYRRVRAAGKSVQVVSIRPHEIPRVLETLGPDGFYFHTGFEDEAHAAKTMRELERFR